MFAFALFIIAALFLWALNRSADAFDALYEAERTSEYRLAWACGRNPHDARLDLRDQVYS
jgi:hypothetical protein